MRVDFSSQWQALEYLVFLGNPRHEPLDNLKAGNVLPTPNGCVDNSMSLTRKPLIIIMIIIHNLNL